MKIRKLALTISILSVLAFASIGFSAWVITNPDSSKTADGTITVEDVTSNAFGLDIQFVDNKKTIVYGTKSLDTSLDNKWLKNDSVGEENLSATIEVKLTPIGNTIEQIFESNSLNVELTGKKNDSTLDTETFNNLFTDATLGTPILKVSKDNGVSDSFNNLIILKKDNFAIKQDSKTTYYVCYIKVEFSWGTHNWGSYTNPYQYYNSKPFDAELAIEANNFLEKVYNNLNGLSYVLTISSTKSN